MTHVSKPLIGLLAATVLVFALYTVALKPGGSSSGGGSSQPGAYQSAIAKARAVQGVVNGAATRSGGTPTLSATPTISTPKQSAPASTQPSATATVPAATGQQSQASSAHVSRASVSAKASTHPTGATAAAGATAAERFHTVQAALAQHKVLALLFYNPASPDDRAVESELSSIPTHGGAVVKLAVPVGELASYSSLLSQDPINYSPTLLLIDRQGQAQEIAGFADSFEIDQRVAGVLGS